jgi:hypothetical protein
MADLVPSQQGALSQQMAQALMAGGNDPMQQALNTPYGQQGAQTQLPMQGGSMMMQRPPGMQMPMNPNMKDQSRFMSHQYPPSMLGVSPPSLGPNFR